MSKLHSLIRQRTVNTWCLGKVAQGNRTAKEFWPRGLLGGSFSQELRSPHSVKMSESSLGHENPFAKVSFIPQHGIVTWTCSDVQQFPEHWNKLTDIHCSLNGNLHNCQNLGTVGLSEDCCCCTKQLLPCSPIAKTPVN